MSKSEFHFIGIGGVGMSALARILLEKQMKVTGSDLSLSATVKELKEKGAAITLEQQGALLKSDSVVVYSSDIKKTNPEFQKAIDLKCQLLHRSELLHSLTSGYKTLAVAGTHGKTTTTSLLATTLMLGGFDPTFAVGGTVQNYGVNGRAGRGEYFVLEADESDGTFLNYSPYGAIITNVEREHMPYWQTEERLFQGFKNFADKISKFLFYCGDCKVLREQNKGRGISYGFDARCDLRVSNVRNSGWGILFDIDFEKKKYRDIFLPLLGEHNALNAAAVFGLSLRLGMSEDNIRSAFKQFAGVKRRLEKKGEYRQVLLLDDYGHHPTEIKATLKALRGSAGERRVVAFFQPHRYTRVAEHLEEFATSFDFADHVVVTDIYGAREEPIAGINPDKIMERIKACSTVPLSYVARKESASYLANFLRPHDILITLGAGDVTAIHEELNALFQKNPPRKYVLGLIFGGRSCEHEISIRSTKFVESSLSRQLYDIRYFGIDKRGKWVTGESAKEALFNKIAIEDSEEAKSVMHPEVAKQIEECDIFFPVLHGPFGEDGTIQGFFEMLSKPYAGPDFRSAAITMDKVLTKKLLIAGGVPTPKYETFSFWKWREDPSAICDTIVKQNLKFPLFVKPMRVGSSVGVRRVENREEMIAAIDAAFRFDAYVLVEEGQIDCRELEFAVLGNSSIVVSVPHPGEKCAEGKPVDYEMKYSSSPVKTDLNPVLEPSLLAKGKELAKKAYEAVGITGMSRVDCLLNKNGEFHFFEINSIPGLTKLSLFPKIWDREGVNGEKLMDRLVILGLQRHNEQNRHLNPL